MLSYRLRRLFDFLKTKHAGELVSREEILRSTGWKISSLNTYISKNNITPFLKPTSSGRFQILRNGADVLESDVQRAFTQVRQAAFVPRQGMQFRGELGAYELICEIGQGAVGHVWRCSRGETNVAAKILNPRPDLLDPKVIPNVEKRFAREARNGRGVRHDNIIPYLDFGTLDGHPVLIMALADGSVADALKTGALALPSTVGIIECCLQGLSHLHSLECVHRDVKPANILRTGSRHVLGDLGIVNWSDMNPSFVSAGTITRDSLQLGSWHYMAPEQARAPHSATAASDVYALGISWYQMLTNTTPIPADVAAGEFAAATTDPVVDQMIRRMVSHKPAARPPLAEVLELVQRFSNRAL